MRSVALLLVDRSSFGLLALAALLALGCSVPPASTIHPKYAELKPKVIQVLPVKNETRRKDLEGYCPDALLQRMVTGGRKIDVLEVFRKAAEEAAQQRGYTISKDAPGAGGATMKIVLKEWRDGSRFGASEIVFSCKLELSRSPSGESLYSTSVHHIAESRGSSQRKLMAPQVVREIVRAVRGGLQQLPLLE